MIRRRRKVREIEFSFDSFLDVVANVVGIILRLILVAWVGARSYKAVVPTLPLPTLTREEIAELPDPKDPLVAELEKQRRELAEAQARLLEQLKEWRKLRQDSTLTAEELARLTAQVGEVDLQRKNVEDKTRQDTQAARNAVLSLQEIRERRKRVMEEIEALRKQAAKKQTLRYRTPVSHVVQREMEFECRRGRVTFIDIAGFDHEIKRALSEEGIKALDETGHFENVTQPIGPFRMRYKMELDSFTRQPLLSWAEVEPMMLLRGETLEKALSPGSDFRRIIDNSESSITTVTLWVYPDSFPLYRKLRDYMHERKFDVAGRPAPEGMGMTYSAFGTRSRGQ